MQHKLMPSTYTSAKYCTNTSLNTHTHIHTCDIESHTSQAQMHLRPRNMLHRQEGAQIRCGAPGCVHRPHNLAAHGPALRSPSKTEAHVWPYRSIPLPTELSQSQAGRERSQYDTGASMSFSSLCPCPVARQMSLLWIW